MIRWWLGQETHAWLAEEQADAFIGNMHAKCESGRMECANDLWNMINSRCNEEKTYIITSYWDLARLKWPFLRVKYWLLILGEQMANKNALL